MTGALIYSRRLSLQERVRIGFRFWVGIRVLIVTVRLGVKGRVIRYVSESPHKDRSVFVCVVFPPPQCFLFKNKAATSEVLKKKAWVNLVSFCSSLFYSSFQGDSTD